ncbi:hypothetical protein L1887_48473 [Cichorium endivia]|nr:hypothetical protein L1887_48473 [Cichorium endivia]
MKAIQALRGVARPSRMATSVPRHAVKPVMARFSTSALSRMPSDDPGGKPNTGQHRTVYDDFYNILAPRHTLDLDRHRLYITDDHYASRWPGPFRACGDPQQSGVSLRPSATQPGLRNTLRQKGSTPTNADQAVFERACIQLDVQSTHDAASTFNMLSEEGRKVAAILIPAEPTEKVRYTPQQLERLLAGEALNCLTPFTQHTHTCRNAHSSTRTACGSARRLNCALLLVAPAVGRIRDRLARAFRNLGRDRLDERPRKTMPVHANQANGKPVNNHAMDETSRHGTNLRDETAQRRNAETAIEPQEAREEGVGLEHAPALGVGYWWSLLDHVQEDLPAGILARRAGECVALHLGLDQVHGVDDQPRQNARGRTGEERHHGARNAVQTWTCTPGLRLGVARDKAADGVVEAKVECGAKSDVGGGLKARLRHEGATATAALRRLLDKTLLDGDEVLELTLHFDEFERRRTARDDDAAGGAACCAGECSVEKAGRVKDVLAMQGGFGVVVDGEGGGAHKRDGDERDGDAAKEAAKAFLAHDGFGARPYGRIAVPAVTTVRLVSRKSSTSSLVHCCERAQSTVRAYTDVGPRSDGEWIVYLACCDVGEVGEVGDARGKVRVESSVRRNAGDVKSHQKKARGWQIGSRRWRCDVPMKSGRPIWSAFCFFSAPPAASVVPFFRMDRAPSSQFRHADTDTPSGRPSPSPHHSTARRHAKMISKRCCDCTRRSESWSCRLFSSAGERVVVRARVKAAHAVDVVALLEGLLDRLDVDARLKLLLAVVLGQAVLNIVLRGRGCG